MVPASCTKTAVAAWAELKTRTHPAVTPGLQDTIKGSVRGGPVRAMKKTVNWSVSIMTVFYLAVAISGYMAYGNDVAGERGPAGQQAGCSSLRAAHPYHPDHPDQHLMSLQPPRPLLDTRLRDVSVRGASRFAPDRGPTPAGAAGNILDSFQTPRWLVDMANIMVFVHLLPACE